jgi:hypothetical protein
LYQLNWTKHAHNHFKGHSWIFKEKSLQLLIQLYRHCWMQHEEEQFFHIQFQLFILQTEVFFQQGGLALMNYLSIDFPTVPQSCHTANFLFDIGKVRQLLVWNLHSPIIHWGNLKHNETCTNWLESLFSQRNLSRSKGSLQMGVTCLVYLPWLILFWDKLIFWIHLIN